MLYGRYDLLDKLTAYKVRLALKEPPGRGESQIRPYETGTDNFGGMCGVVGTLEYIVWVGEIFGGELADRYSADYTELRLSFKLGVSAIRSYEFEFSHLLLDILEETPGVTIYGITDTKRLEERVPTCAFTLNGKSPRQVAEELDEENIYVWDGNYYALAVTERLGLEESGGMVRVGPVPQTCGLQPSARFLGAQSPHFGEHWRRSGGLGRRWGGLRRAVGNGLRYVLVFGIWMRIKSRFRLGVENTEKPESLR